MLFLLIGYRFFSQVFSFSLIGFVMLLGLAALDISLWRTDFLCLSVNINAKHVLMWIMCFKAITGFSESLNAQQLIVFSVMQGYSWTFNVHLFVSVFLICLLLFHYYAAFLAQIYWEKINAEACNLVAHSVEFFCAKVTHKPIV